jgi:hypothetical protein
MAVVQAAYAGVDINLDVCGNKIYYVDSGGPPAAGTYLQGDLAMVVPVPGGVAPSGFSPLFYRCSVAGTPGTWVSVDGSGGGGFGAAVASASSITPTGAIFHVTGTTTVNTVVVPAGIQSGGQITIIPDGVFTLGTTGNISVGGTSVVGKALILTWDATAVKWYLSYFS